MINAIYTIWLRNLKRYIRSPSRIIGSLAQPLFFLLILGFGLNNIMIPGSGQNYAKFMVPGIVAMSVLFTSVFSGIQIIWDKQFGFIKETLIAPVSRISIMIGQTIGGATTAFIQGTIVLILSSLIGGILPSILGLLIAITFMGLIGITFTAFGIAIASRMEDMHGFQMIMNFFIFPTFFTSGALFPLTNAPAVLKTITYFNPLTYGVEGIRYGLFRTSMINPINSLLVLVSVLCFAFVIGGYLFKTIKL